VFRDDAFPAGRACSLEKLRAAADLGLTQLEGGMLGIGEQALIPTAPAIFNAIYHATGVRLRRAPATPDRLRAAIQELRR